MALPSRMRAGTVLPRSPCAGSINCRARDCALSFNAAYIVHPLSHHSLEDSGLLQRMSVYSREQVTCGPWVKPATLCLDLWCMFVLCVGVCVLVIPFFLMQNPSSG